MPGLIKPQDNQRRTLDSASKTEQGIVDSMPKIAIYPGSFDPPTLGHLDVLDRAARLFDKVIVAVGRNSSKAPMLTVEERVEALRRCCSHLPNVEADEFDGLLVEYARKKGASAIVRGLRATADFDYEFQIAMANRRLAGEIETVFLMTKWEHSFLSSSIVREVARLGGDFDQFVPAPVAEIVRNSLSRQSK
jgi:pantetheine-phosphate adenylyltransferase